jgi:hypothetical protein
MQLGSMFINNCNNALHVSDAICVHLQEHLKTVVTGSGVRHEMGRSIQWERPRSMASALSHIVYRLLVINKHTAKLHHVGSLYILTYDARKIKHKIDRIL